MSRRPHAYVTISQILSGKWLMLPREAEAHFPIVLSLLEGKKAFDDDGDADREPQATRLLNDPSVYFISEWAEANPPENAPANSVAVIGLRGAITKYDQWCGGPGTMTKLDHFNRAMANPNIKGVVFAIDSGGGEGAAVELLTSAIQNSTKPVVAYVNGIACSAAYWIASKTQHIVMDGKTSEVGSIGTYVSVADFRKFYEQKGIDIIEVYAPQSILKNKSYRDLLAGKDDEMKADLKVYTDFFINAVKENRQGKLSDNQTIFQGAVFYAEDAVNQGLADQMGTLEDAVAKVRELSSATATQIATTLNSNMKYSFKAAWTSLLAFLSLTPQAGQETIEHEVTQEQWEKLNTQIGANESLKTQVTELTEQLRLEKEAHTATKGQLTEMTTSRDDFKTKWEAKPAVSPGAKVSESGDPQVDDNAPELSASHQAAINTLNEV